MKNMDYEKKYNEALNWMRELYPGLHGATKEDAEHYFPELKESEDEKIRKRIHLCLDECVHSDIIRDYERDECLAYLKKQKEQKPSINIDQLKSLMLQYLQEAANEKEDSDIEADTDKWARKILGYDFEQKPAEWSEEDEHRCSDAIYFLETAKKHYADTSEIELTIDWLKSLRPQPKQKPEAKLTGWVARDSKYNSYFGLGLVLFKGKPRRSGECWSGAIAAQLPWELFPDLKWEDEPMEVEVTIRKK